MRSKKVPTLGVLLELLLVHERELRGARNEHGQHVLLVVLRVLPVVLDDALDGERVEKLLHVLGGHATGTDHLRKRHGHAHLHAAGELGLLLGHDGGESPVVGIGNLGLVANAVRDLLRLGEHGGLELLGRGPDRAGPGRWAPTA